MKLRKIAIVMSVSLFLAPMLANAGDFKITNHTKQELSFSINDTCSDTFGSVKANDIEIVYEEQLLQACTSDPSNCEVKVHDAANCKGDEVGMILFDIKSGITKINPEGLYSIEGNGFYLTFRSPVISTSK